MQNKKPELLNHPQFDSKITEYSDHCEDSDNARRNDKTTSDKTQEIKKILD